MWQSKTLNAFLFVMGRKIEPSIQIWAFRACITAKNSQRSTNLRTSNAQVTESLPGQGEDGTPTDVRVRPRSGDRTMQMKFHLAPTPRVPVQRATALNDFNAEKVLHFVMGRSNLYFLQATRPHVQGAP
jgi:hypothetical protein